MKDTTIELLTLMRRLESPGLQSLVVIQLHIINHGRKTPILFNVAHMGRVKLATEEMQKNGCHSRIDLTEKIFGSDHMFTTESPPQIMKKINARTAEILSIALGEAAA